MKLGKLLREDEYGHVYMGHWRGTKSTIRVLRAKIGRNLSTDGAKELLSEVAVAFRHPYMALHMGACGLDTQDDSIMTICEWLPRGTVTQCINEEKPSATTVCMWVLELFKAVAFLHAWSPKVMSLHSASSILACEYIYIYIYIYVSMYVCMYVCMYTCT